MSRPLVSSTRVALGEPVSMNGILLQASRADLAVFEWHWDINGDGSPDYYGPDSYHVFHNTGYYPLTLNVVDTDGKRDSSILWIEVYNPIMQ